MPVVHEGGLPSRIRSRRHVKKADGELVSLATTITDTKESSRMRTIRSGLTPRSISSNLQLMDHGLQIVNKPDLFQGFGPVGVVLEAIPMEPVVHEPLSNPLLSGQRCHNIA